MQQQQTIRREPQAVIFGQVELYQREIRKGAAKFTELMQQGKIEQARAEARRVLRVAHECAELKRCAFR